MDYAVIQLPVNNNNNALNAGQILTNNLSGSGNAPVINLIVPKQVLQNADNNFFNDDLGNWSDWDNDFSGNDYTNSGLNSSSPFIRNFFRNIYKGNNSSWSDAYGGVNETRSQRAKRKLKTLLNELLRLCSGSNNSSIRF